MTGRQARHAPVSDSHDKTPNPMSPSSGRVPGTGISAGCTAGHQVGGSSWGQGNHANRAENVPGVILVRSTGTPGNNEPFPAASPIAGRRDAVWSSENNATPSTTRNHANNKTKRNMFNTNPIPASGQQPLALSTNPSNVVQIPPAGGEATPESIGAPQRTTMNGKPVLWRTNTGTVVTDPSPEFGHKLLCDSLVFNTGDACAFSCEYCYVKGAMWKLVKPIVDAHNAAEGTSCDFSDLVIRRSNTLTVLDGQLTRKDGSLKYADPTDHRVIFSSTLVDVAANMELLRETAAACNLILEKTGWQIRLLSKSNLLARVVEFIPEQYHDRLILGFSTGTLDPRVSRAIESGTPHVGRRIEALHSLQDSGFRTFGMICPSLPQHDYDQFSREICAAIRVDRCEHVWAEPLNVRPGALPRTLERLREEGLDDEAEMLQSVHGSEAAKAAWEEYARQTFLAHTRNIPAEKLRYLQYVNANSAAWWSAQRQNGAVLLGAKAKELGLCASAETLSAAPEFY